MLDSSLIVLNGLLHKYRAEDQVSLLEPLSDKSKQALEKAFSPISIDPNKFTLKFLLKDVHYSWYLPFLKTFNKKDQALSLSALDDKTKKKLERYLKIKRPKTSPSKLIIDFFQMLLFEKIINLNEELLPQEYLPPSDLNFLLELTKKEIITLIDYLALFDLSSSINKVLDPTVLKKIDSFLSDEQKQFVKSKKNYKEPFSFPVLKFHEAIDSKEEFDLLLHKRGLNRFAQGFCAQDISLIWYICHKLDIGRGKVLYKLCREERAPQEIIKTITSNIMELLPIIRT